MALFYPVSTLQDYSRITFEVDNIISVDAGEKMGLQITVLLADVIYVETLQSTVPVFDSLGSGDNHFSSGWKSMSLKNIGDVRQHRCWRQVDVDDNFRALVTEFRYR